MEEKKKTTNNTRKRSRKVGKSSYRGIGIAFRPKRRHID